MLEKLSKNLFAVFSPNSGSNSFLLTGKKNTLIDAGLEQNTGYLLQALSETGFSAEDIDVLLFTHGHTDHFSAAKPFSKADSLMHSFDAGYVKAKDPVFTASALFETDFYPSISSFLDNEKTLDLGSFALQVILSPGHTSGSVCFFDSGKKLLFSGDTLFFRGRGRDDLPSGDHLELEKSIKNLLSLDFDILLPGHGSLLKSNQKQNIEIALKTFSSAYL